MITGFPISKHTTPSTKAASTPAGLFADDTHTHRCAWCQATPDYRRYQDTEWGFPVADERRLFKKNLPRRFAGGFELADHPQQA